MRLIAAIQTSDWIFNARVLSFPMCDTSKGDAMTEKRHATQEAPVPDLLAALTAYGLGSPRLPRQADQEARRSWLARYLEWTFARDDARTAPRSPDLDDEWVGGSYALARRLLELALRAHR